MSIREGITSNPQTSSRIYQTPRKAVFVDDLLKRTKTSMFYFNRADLYRIKNRILKSKSFNKFKGKYVDRKQLLRSKTIDVEPIRNYYEEIEG